MFNTKTHIKDLGQFIENSTHELIVLGQPKGIGVTTNVILYFVDKFFFEEPFNVLILVENMQEKITVAKIFEKYLFEDYNLKVKFDYSTNKLSYLDNNVVILSYTHEDKSELFVPENFKFDYGYIDKDANTPKLNYFLTDYLPFNCEKIIVATYDFEDSIYYMKQLSDEQKTIVFSEQLYSNLVELDNLPSYTIEYEKIIKGEFKDEEN